MMVTYQITPKRTGKKQSAIVLTELWQGRAEMACLCSMISWTSKRRLKGWKANHLKAHRSYPLSKSSSWAVSWDTNTWLFYAPWPSSKHVSCVPKQESWERVRFSRSHITFYELALEITQCHLCHILLVELQKSTQFQGERKRLHLLMEQYVHHIVKIVCMLEYIDMAMMENTICCSKLGDLFD